MRTKIRDRNVLFLCSDGSLSLIAEAIALSLNPPGTRIFSAGVAPRPVGSRTIQALRQWGLRLPARSKGLEHMGGVPLDLIVGLGRIDVAALVFPSARWDHWPIRTPSEETSTDLAPFHRAVSQIDERVNALFLDHWRNLAGEERRAHGV